MEVVGLGSVIKYAVNVENLPAGTHLSDTGVNITVVFYLDGYFENGNKIEVLKGGSNMVIKQGENVAICFVETASFQNEEGTIKGGNIMALVDVEYKDPDTQHAIKDTSIVNTDVAVTSPR